MSDLIQRELELEAPAGAVWEAITDPAWLEAWLAEEVLLQLWPGGEARFTIGDEVRDGWVEEVTPPAGDDEQAACARLAFWWSQGDEPASRVELELTPLPSGTRLRVTETRPLQVLDLVGVPLPGQSGRRFGPAMVAAGR